MTAERLLPQVVNSDERAQARNASTGGTGHVFLEVIMENTSVVLAG